MNDINGNPWEEAINEDRNEQMNSVLQQDFDDQRAMLADSENADRADRETSAKQQLFMRNLMGVIVKRSGGGPISPRLANWANGVLRKAGVQDGGIAPGGGFDKSGNFVIPTYAVDANGSQVPGRGVRYDGRSLYAMMNQLRGIFNDNDISRGADFLRKSGVGEKEIASLSYNPFATMLSDKEKQRRAMLNYRTGDPDHISNRLGGGAGGREVGSTGTFKRPVAEKHGIHFFASDGKGGFTRSDWTPEGGEETLDYGTRDPNYQGRWKVRVNGPDGKVYENDKTGEEVTVKPGENLRDVLAKSETTQKDKTGAGVEIAKINAASREKVAGMTTESREKISEGNNQTRREIAGAQIASREKIAEAANVLKQYGIDVSAELKERGYDLQEKRNAEVARHNKESEGIAGSRLREQERHNRAGEEVADRRASAQEQRVEDQYELGDRKQRHNENRLQNDKDKAARAAGQRDAELAERKRQFDEREKRLSKPKEQGGAGEDGRKAVSAMKGMLELARSSGMSEEDLADLESWTNERIKGLAGIGGETSGDGGTKGKVKYTDLKPGQKFTMTDKDGKKRRCVKTEKGYKYID